MILGIGCDIAQVSRFERWVKSPGMIARVFAPEERLAGSLAGDTGGRRLNAACQHYAARFAAKEAFAKALGTGLAFAPSEVCVKKQDGGRPYLALTGTALELCRARCGTDCAVHLSLSHEKDYATAFVVIESI